MNNLKVKLLVACIIGLNYINASAGGYMFGASSTDAISTGLNNAAEVNNPSVMSANPAGITHLDGTSITQSIIFVDPKIKYYNAQGKYFKTHEPISGQPDGKSNAHSSFSPSFFLSNQINDNIYTGLAIYPNMAAMVDYDLKSVLRYNINKIKLISVNVQPTIAFKINNDHSIGLGVIAQYSNAKLREFADVNSGINYQLPLIGTLGYQIIPRKTDAYGNLKGQDINVGFNLGYMWDINDSLRMGIAYNSRIKHKLKGTAQWEFYGEAFDWPLLGKLLREGIRENGYVEKESVNVDFNSPESVNIHASWKVTPKLNLLTQAVWTRHSIFNDLSINFEKDKTIPNGKTGVTDIKSNVYQLKPVWRNTWKFGLGSTYQINDKLQLRAGISYDRTPIKNSISRYSVLPDNDRIILGLGANYTINENSNITLGYMHEKVKKSHSDTNGWCGGPELGSNSKNCISSRTGISTDFKVSANLLGIQFNKRF